MPIVAPMATWKPFTDPKSTTALTHDIICLHTMVGTLSGSWSWANGDGNPYWHFGLHGNGTLQQCQDLAYRSAANLNGNWHVIPIETSDTNEGIFPSPWANPLWTQAQLDKLVDLIAWLCVRFNIPPELIPDTKPGRRGIAYHKQGCDPYRVEGGEKWSNAFAKTCPANRIPQITSYIIPRVKAKIAGTPLPAKDWFDMATAAELTTVVRDEVTRAVAALGLGQSNAVYDRGSPPWNALVDLPDVLAAAKAPPTASGATLEQVRTEIGRAVQALGLGQTNAVYSRNEPPWDALVDLPKVLAAVQAGAHVDTDALAAAIVSKLPPQSATDVEAIEAAVREVFADAGAA